MYIEEKQVGQYVASVLIAWAATSVRVWQKSRNTMSKDTVNV